MLRGEIDSALSKVLSIDRFMIARVNVKLDTSKETTESKEYAPIELQSQDPKASYNTRKVSDSTIISSQTQKKNIRDKDIVLGDLLGRKAILLLNIKI